MLFAGSRGSSPTTPPGLQSPARQGHTTVPPPAPVKPPGRDFEGAKFAGPQRQAAAAMAERRAALRAAQEVDLRAEDAHAARLREARDRQAPGAPTSPQPWDWLDHAGQPGLALVFSPRPLCTLHTLLTVPTLHALLTIRTLAPAGRRPGLPHALPRLRARRRRLDARADCGYA